MFETIAALASSSGLGAIVGAVGSWVSKIEERKAQREANEHERQMTELSMREMQMEQSHALDVADKGIEQTRTEGGIAVDIQEAEAFKASVASQAKATGIAFVDAVRGLMRPIITAYLLGIATYVAYSVSTLVGGLEAIGPVELLDLYQEVLLQLLFLTTVAVTWWFGSRPQSKQGR